MNTLNRKLSLLLIVSSLLLFSLTINGQEVSDAEDNPEYPQVNCVFVGCSCQGDDEIVILQNSNEIEEASPDAKLAKDVSYDILCKDEENPSFKFKSFPLRDNSKTYSHQILTLDLAGNELTVIPANRLGDLEISSAVFSQNQISGLSEEAFKGVMKLESLDLSVNKLSDLNEKTFEPIQSSLMHLKINENQLGQIADQKLEKILNSLKKLRTLHMRSNDLTKLPNLSQLSQLDELALQSNQIESLNDQRQLLPSSLIDLNVNNNRIKQLTANTLSNLVNLKYLNLESNQISSISEDAFTYLTKLLQIHLAKNYLKQIPPRILYSLSDLQRLDLSAQNQMIKQIDDYAFDRRVNTNQITKIDLSKNKIVSMSSKAFCSRNLSQPFVNVKELDLALNPLSSINSCVLRQMSKGFNEVARGVASNPKVSFKPTHSLEKLTPTLKCDCEIAKAALLVDFEGDCENEQGNTVELRKYKCSSDLSKQEVEDSCASQAEFDCVDQSSNKITTGSKDTFKQGVDLKTDTPNNNNNKNSKPADIQNNPNTKLPIKEAASGNNNNIKQSESVASISRLNVFYVFSLTLTTCWLSIF